MYKYTADICDIFQFQVYNAPSYEYYRGYYSGTCTTGTTGTTVQYSLNQVV